MYGDQRIKAVQKSSTLHPYKTSPGQQSPIVSGDSLFF